MNDSRCSGFKHSVAAHQVKIDILGYFCICCSFCLLLKIIVKGEHVVPIGISETVNSLISEAEL